MFEQQFRKYGVYLWSVPEFMAHDVVQKWIYTGWKEVRDSRGVRQCNVDSHEDVVATKRLVHYLSINRHYPLRVERSPAEKKCRDNGNCKEKNLIYRS